MTKKVLFFALVLGSFSAPITNSAVAGVPLLILRPQTAPPSLQTEALKAEKDGRWNEALDLYLRLYNSANSPPEVRDRIRVCLRNLNQYRRHRDPAFQQFVLTLRPSVSLDLYTEAIDQLTRLYADRSKCTLDRLFALGISEFDHSLADPSFRQLHINAGSDARVQQFRESLRTNWPQRLPNSTREVRTAAFELLRDSRDQLGIKNGSAIVLELLCGACSGLDEFTFYLAPTGAQASLASPLAELAEYGLLVRPVEMTGIVVDGIIAGSWAAHHTSIRRGDRINRINGHLVDPQNPVAHLVALQSSQMFGHELELIAQEDGTQSTVRLPIPLPSVFGNGILQPKDGVAYVRLAAIRESTPRELEDAVLSLKARGARVLIVDVRGNIGGHFLAGIQIAQRFLSAGIIVTTQGQSPEFANRVFSSDSGMSAFDLPVVLLVDARTMSTAEAIAMAWKDHGRAILVGLPTFGKGSIQGQIRLGSVDGIEGTRSGLLILTVAQMAGPRGHAVGARVIPHILESDSARQLEIAVAKAVELANGMR